ncbi:MAG: hypothetical protein MK515_13055 [SAR324 cluster bacterium]|nr:hypothetical protein [SAR324 cluster bacterium]
MKKIQKILRKNGKHRPRRKVPYLAYILPLPNVFVLSGLAAPVLFQENISFMIAAYQVSPSVAVCLRVASSSPIWLK